MEDVTQILGMIERGDPDASEQLLPLVYNELKRLATAKMASERFDHTLQATALVHEAYLRLVESCKAARWDSRGHFFAAAAEAMRRILIENARRKQRMKHGGDMARRELSAAEARAENENLRLLALDEALGRLAAQEPMKAELTKLRFFAGLSIDEAASSLNISRATAKRYWSYARAWLLAEVREIEESDFR